MTVPSAWFLVFLVAQTLLSAHNHSRSWVEQGTMVKSSPELRVARRRLPHWTFEGAVYFVTFRLVREPLNRTEIRWLRNRIVAGADRHYELFAATVLPDHAHLLLRPKPGDSLSRVMKGIKGDRKSTRLNSSHSQISYAVFCLKKNNEPKSRVRSSSRTHPIILYTFGALVT